MGTPKIKAPFDVFIDSDGPVADFDLDLRASGLPADEFKLLPGIYLWLQVTNGAANALDLLHQMDNMNQLRVWILTKTPSNSPYAYTEKVLWYRKNFPWLEDRVILTHDKSVVGCEKDVLLDDRPHKANADRFRGKFMFFDPKRPVNSWELFMEVVLARVASQT